MAAKKILTGCLVVVLLGVIGAGAAWWFVLRPMWNAGSEMVSGAKDWATGLDLGAEISNQAPYEAPADGRLTPAQVAALVTVQEVVVREMGGAFGRWPSAPARRRRRDRPTSRRASATSRRPTGRPARCWVA